MRKRLVENANKLDANLNKEEIEQVVKNEFVGKESSRKLGFQKTWNYEKDRSPPVKMTGEKRGGSGVYSWKHGIQPFQTSPLLSQLSKRGCLLTIQKRSAFATPIQDRST